MSRSPVALFVAPRLKVPAVRGVCVHGFYEGSFIDARLCSGAVAGER